MSSRVDHEEQFKNKQQKIIMMDDATTISFPKTTSTSDLEDTSSLMPSASSFHPNPSLIPQGGGGDGGTADDKSSTACR